MQRRRAIARRGLWFMVAVLEDALTEDNETYTCYVHPERCEIGVRAPWRFSVSSTFQLRKE
jgi:hypothetical protein